MNPRKRHLYFLIFALLLVGLSTFFYRHFALGVPLTDKETVNSWTVEANLRFVAERNKPIKASFTIPYLPPNYAILDEYFVSHNYGVTTNLIGENRETVWSIRRSSGPQSLYYRAIFRKTDNSEPSLPKPAPVKVQKVDESLKAAQDTIIEQVRQTSADIQTFAQSTIKILNNRDGNAKLMVGSDFTDENIIQAALKILNQASISGLFVEGISLSGQQNQVDIKYYLAVYNGNKWIYINPKTGSVGLPGNYLIWQYGDKPIFSLSGGVKPSFTITITQTPINALTIAKTRGTITDSQLLRFSLIQLPIRAQETYKILLMVPLGGFIILLLRNFVGLKTFGTFMPVLIAIAFRETHVIWGLFLFSFIVSAGLLIRFYLDQLRLLLVPRLASILTVVIILMIFISVMGQNLGFDTGLSVALFPMVILTMTIERMCILWDERGPYEAIIAGVGSLFAAVICYFAMNIEAVQYLFFAFPELLLVLLAMILLFGQYRGYRLLEIFRFKALAQRI